MNCRATAFSSACMLQLERLPARLKLPLSSTPPLLRKKKPRCLGYPLGLQIARIFQRDYHSSTPTKGEKERDDGLLGELQQGLSSNEAIPTNCPFPATRRSWSLRGPAIGDFSRLKAVFPYSDVRESPIGV